MNLFIIVFHKSITPEIENEVNSAPLVKQAFRVTDHDMLVQSYVDNSRVIAENIGIDGGLEEPPLGVVFRLEGSYSGYHDDALWDWLEAARV